MQLGEATPAELARYVQLALDANLDLLRLHAHVSRPELYDAADAAGLLVWQDFPLQWGYACWASASLRCAKPCDGRRARPSPEHRALVRGQPTARGRHCRTRASP